MRTLNEGQKVSFDIEADRRSGKRSDQSTSRVSSHYISETGVIVAPAFRFLRQRRFRVRWGRQHPVSRLLGNRPLRRKARRSHLAPALRTAAAEPPHGAHGPAPPHNRAAPPPPP